MPHQSSARLFRIVSLFCATMVLLTSYAPSLLAQTSEPFDTNSTKRTFIPGLTNFMPIKHAFRSGSGKIMKGYGPDWSHSGGDMYALDVCPDSGCNAGDPVLAPTDIKLIWSGVGYGMPSNSKDFHIFEISSDDNGQRLCMSLAHIEITVPGFAIGGHLSRGTAFGRLANYTYGPHIHMGIWHSPQSGGCASDSRTPIPFTGNYQLDGINYDSGQITRESVLYQQTNQYVQILLIVFPLHNPFPPSTPPPSSATSPCPMAAWLPLGRASPRRGG